VDFFKPFTEQDWVTFGLAALAFLVSAGSLVQNHFFRARPHFTFEWAQESFEYPGGVIVTVCRFWNDGDATARNVRLEIDGAGIVTKVKEWDHWDEFKPGERHGFEVPLESALRDWAAPGAHPRNLDIYPVESTPPPTRPGQLPADRPLIRPVVSIRYRGRWRKVKTKAPDPSRLTLMVASAGC
jgi:hypothetical protein